MGEGCSQLKWNELRGSFDIRQEVGNGVSSIAFDRVMLVEVRGCLKVGV